MRPNSGELIDDGAYLALEIPGDETRPAVSSDIPQMLHYPRGTTIIDQESAAVARKIKRDLAKERQNVVKKSPKFDPDKKSTWFVKNQAEAGGEKSHSNIIKKKPLGKKSKWFVKGSQIPPKTIF